MGKIAQLFEAYRWRRKRQRLIARAWFKRRELRVVSDRTASIQPGDALVFCTLRNEAARLPHFLQHYRALGVAHFLIIDNDSTDGATNALLDAPDVSLWRTKASYRRARFGMDWVQALLMRHGRGHWCLTVDADELFVYPHHTTRPLPALTAWLEEQGCAMMGALMLDLYPRGPLGAQSFAPGDDPMAVLTHYDSANYVMARKTDTRALWIQGGPRARAFFAEDPRRAPTLTKVPLVKWHWRYAYLNSTHVMLPRGLNQIADREGGEAPSGVLLHTKFLPEIGAKSCEEKARREHFGDPAAFDGYYDALIDGPDLSHAYSSAYQGWQRLEAEGLMSRGGWG